MKKLKNKKTFLLFLLGFYALVAIFTGTAMYLPYIDAEETSNEEDYSESEEASEEEEISDEGEEEYTEEDFESTEDTDSEEDSTDEEDSDTEEASDDEEYSDEEEYSDDEEYSNEEYSDEEEYSDDEEYSDEEEYIDAEDDSEDTEDTTDDTAIPHTEDTESGIDDNSVALPTPIPESNTEDSSEDFPLAFSYNGTGKLNIRKEPSKTGSIVGAISNNSTGMILEFANDQWAKITCNDLEGYVAYEYIEYTLPEGTLTPTPTPTAMP